MIHKGGQSTCKDWGKCMKKGDKFTEFVLLARTMVVVDADSSEVVAMLESKYPALLKCPCVQKRKGKHYYSLRSNLCEEKNVTDSTSVWKQVDLKTVTNNYHEHVSGDGSKIPTAGVVVDTFYSIEYFGGDKFVEEIEFCKDGQSCHSNFEFGRLGSHGWIQSEANNDGP